MQTNRRVFLYWMSALVAMSNELLKGAFDWLALGGSKALAIPGVAEAYAAATEPGPAGPAYNPFDHNWSLGLDIEKCIGCGRCVEACKLENGVALDPFHFRTWIERYVIMKDGQVNVDSPNGGFDGFTEKYDPTQVAKSFFVPKMCNHCTDSPCTQVCPVGATFDSPDGVVLIDKDYCIGCRYCIQACPYGCRFFNDETGTADKCTMCYHRITKGLKPACVEVCPTGARIFGDLKDPNNPVQAFIDSHDVQGLKEHLGTHPKIVYNGLDREVR